MDCYSPWGCKELDMTESLSLTDCASLRLVKNLPVNAGNESLIPGSHGSPGEGNGNPNSVFLPRESMDMRSLTDYSPWNHKRIRCDFKTKQQQAVFDIQSNVDFFF